MSRFRTTPSRVNAQGIKHFPELLSADNLGEYPVFLISADLPCCGSTSIAERIGQQVLSLGFDVEAINVGKIIRGKLGVNNEVELGQSIKSVYSMTEFDPEIYGKLPADKVCVVDGKFATTVGPYYIDPQRPVYSVDLTSNLLTSTKRNLGREGTPLMELLTEDASVLLKRYDLLLKRAAHENNMRRLIRVATEAAISAEPTLPLIFKADGPELKTETPIEPVAVRINTNSMCKEEILAYFSGNPEDTKFKHVPTWELNALRDTLATLNYLKVIFDGKTHPSDRQHFNYQFEFARYNIDRLKTTLHTDGISAIRLDIKKALVDCWFGLMMKQVPRFFEDVDGNISLDEVSHAWTPEYYKVAEAWPVLKTMLKNKNILDPFGGAGTLVNLLAARGVIKSAVLSDIAYLGGQPIDNHGHTYATELNAQMSHVLFDNLPSWYKPNLDIIEKRVTANSMDLPFDDDSFDYIVTDPPYGKNHDSGGIGLTIGSLREFERVTKLGTIMLLPMQPTDWAKQISAAGYKVDLLTGDVSGGQSGYPVRYALINHLKKNKS